MFGLPTTALWRFRDNWMLSLMPLMLLEHALQGLVIRKCGENRKPPSTARFFQQNRMLRKGETGPGPRILASPHFRKRSPEVCGKFRNLRAQRSICVKKPQVEALWHACVLGMLGICRILSVWVAFAAGFHGSYRLWSHSFPATTHLMQVSYLLP